AIAGNTLERRDRLGPLERRRRGGREIGRGGRRGGGRRRRDLNDRRGVRSDGRPEPCVEDQGAQGERSRPDDEPRPAAAAEEVGAAVRGGERGNPRDLTITLGLPEGVEDVRHRPPTYRSPPSRGASGPRSAAPRNTVS